MSNVHVADIADSLFDAEVIERSFNQPVLVDFWAPWCGPCRMLGPVLEELAAELNGAFFLAKVNTEECQGVATRFRISGIPAVKLFVNGAVVAEFTGALPKPQVRAFLDEHLPSEAAEALQQGRELLAANKPAQAKQALSKALALDSALHEARIELAKIALGDGDTNEVQALLAPIGNHDALRDSADALLSLTTFATACVDAGGAEAAANKAKEEGDDAVAQLRHGQCLAAAGQYEAALEALLASVRIDRNAEEQAARKAMLAIFQVLGIRSELSNLYRRKLSVFI